MAETKHTPGPWEVWKGHLTVVAGPTKRNTSAVVSGARRTVAEADCDDFDPTEEELANAALIASAPELLESLMAIVGETELDGTYAPEVVLDSIRHLAEAAIAKAEGRADG